MRNGFGLIIKKIVDLYFTVPEFKFLINILFGIITLGIVFLLLKNNL